MSDDRCPCGCGGPLMDCLEPCKRFQQQIQEQDAIIAGLVEVLKELSGCYIYDEGSLFDVRTRSGHVYTEYKGAKQALKDTQALAKQHDERVRQKERERILEKQFDMDLPNGWRIHVVSVDSIQPQGGEG